MKNFKFILPALVFVLAVGLAFANKANIAAPGWIDFNGSPMQLSSEPCTPGSETCRVFFTNNPGVDYDVYETSALEILKTSTTEDSHPIIP